MNIFDSFKSKKEKKANEMKWKIKKLSNNERAEEKNTHTRKRAYHDTYTKNDEINEWRKKKNKQNLLKFLKFLFS